MEFLSPVLYFSFYPLYPCNEEMSIDYEHFQSYATMPATPHILIIPSDFKQFVKVTIVKPLDKRVSKN